MSRRKSHAQPHPPNAPGRVDDVLLRNHRMRERIHKVLASSQAEDLSVEDARRMTAQIQRKGPQAIQALFDRLFDENDENSHRMAILLLTEIKDSVVAGRIHELLQRPQLPERVRIALLAIEALQNTPPEEVPNLTSVPEISLDSLLQFSEKFWESMEMEEISMMWRENFADEPPEDRLVVLKALMKSANPKMLGVAQLEIALADPGVVQFLAKEIVRFRSPMVPPLLQSLLQHPDLVVRTLADQSLTYWREQTARNPLQEQECPPAPRFYRAHMATDEWSGHYSLVYSVKGPDGLIKFLVVLLDRWDRGIIDCWGCVRYSAEDFEQLLRNMARDFADLHQKRVSKRTALTLLHKATLLNLERNHPLPLEFSIWSHLLAGERFSDDPAVPEFGVDCGICKKPVHTGPRIPPPWVFNQLVVCHRCSKRSLKCPACGGPTTIPECYLVREDSHDAVDLRCPHCFESFPMPQ